MDQSTSVVLNRFKSPDVTAVRSGQRGAQQVSSPQQSCRPARGCPEWAAPVGRRAPLLFARVSPLSAACILSRGHPLVPAESGSKEGFGKEAVAPLKTRAPEVPRDRRLRQWPLVVTSVLVPTQAVPAAPAGKEGGGGERRRSGQRKPGPPPGLP